MAGTSGTNYNFINTPGGRRIWVGCTNISNIPSYKIMIYDNAGNPYESGTLGLNNWVDWAQAFPQIPVQIGSLDNVEYMRIIPTITYVNSPGFPPIPSSNLKPVLIHFVDLEFTVTNANGGCLTLDNGTVNFSTNLDGLCNPGEIRIKMPAGALNTYGLGPNYTSDPLKPGDPYTIPMNNFCSTTMSYPVNGWLPPRCLEFELEFTLKPCPDFDDGNVNCPEIKVSKKQLFCCECEPRLENPGQ